MTVEFSNDANTFCVVEDDRETFTIQAGGRSGTPVIEIPVINGNIVRVTVQFIAQNNSGGSFGYSVIATSSDAKIITKRAASIASGNTGWQLCQRDDVFLITLPANTGQDDATFEIAFSAPDGSVDAKAGSYVIIAQLVGSSVIPA